MIVSDYMYFLCLESFPCTGDGRFLTRTGRIPADQEGLTPILLGLAISHVLPAILWSQVYTHLKLRLTGE